MKFMMPRSEEEGRAWLAINSVDENIFKLFLKCVPILTAAAIVVAVIMGVFVVMRGSPTGFWDWFLFLVVCASCASLTYISIKVRRKGVDFFFSDGAQEPLDLLSDKERRDYRILTWIATGVAALFVVVVSLALVLHFNGFIRLATPAWMVLAGSFVLTVCLFYGFIQRTRRLVRIMTTQLADEHVPTTALDS